MGTWRIYKKHFLQLILTKKQQLSFDKISPRDFHFFPFFSICTCPIWQQHLLYMICMVTLNKGLKERLVSTFWNKTSWYFTTFEHSLRILQIYQSAYKVLSYVHLISRPVFFDIIFRMQNFKISMFSMCVFEKGVLVPVFVTSYPAVITFLCVYTLVLWPFSVGIVSTSLKDVTLLLIWLQRTGQPCQHDD